MHLAHPLLASLGSAKVLLVDVSILGARVEHHVPLPAGGLTMLSFRWDETEIASPCRVVRSRLERFSVGTDGLMVYHSGLEFVDMPAHMRDRLKSMLIRFITSALEEQKLNARGAMPEHDVNRMPIFRFGGQLTANLKDKELVEPRAFVPVARRLIRETGYVCYALENNQWRRKRTHDPGQPHDGFTISAAEEQTQAELLCDAYLRADGEGRRMIQLLAQMSIIEGEGAVPA